MTPEEYTRQALDRGFTRAVIEQYQREDQQCLDQWLGWGEPEHEHGRKVVRRLRERIALREQVLENWQDEEGAAA